MAQLAPDHSSIIVTNKTARRISVEATSGQAADCLIIPPFGQRKLLASELKNYKTTGWERGDLIQCASPNVQRQAPLYTPLVISGLIILFVLVVGGGWLAAIQLLNYIHLSLFQTLTTWYVWTALLVVVGGVVLTKLNKRNQCFQILRFLCVSGVGVLTPLLMTRFLIDPAALFVSSAQELACSKLSIPLANNGCSITFIWLFIRLDFIIVASVLPGLLYFFFYRQKLNTLRGAFIHDVMRLDPNIQTTDDAESRYGPRIDDIYGSGDAGDFLGGAFVPILVCTYLITLGWILTLRPFELQTSTQHSFGATFTPIDFAFFGSYFFGINMLFRRYVRADLGPKAYSNVAVRIILSFILVWLIQMLPLAPLMVTSSTGVQPSYSDIWLAVAFFVGFLPETGLQFVKEWLSKIQLPWKPTDTQDKQPLTDLEGINLYDRTRLMDEGIENVENLAHHNLIELMLWTRIPTPRIVDLVDQAILYLHTTNRPKAADTSATSYFDGLHTYGIRTATDVEKAYASAIKREQKADPAFLTLLDAGTAGGPVKRLQVILDTLQDDEWMVHLRHWRALTNVGEVPCTLEDIYARDTTKPVWKKAINSLRSKATPPAPHEASPSTAPVGQQNGNS